MKLKRYFKLLSIIIVVVSLIITGLILTKDFLHNTNGHDNINASQNQIDTQNKEQESGSDDELNIEENNSNDNPNSSDIDKEQEIIDNNNNNNGNSTYNNQEINKDQESDIDVKEEISDENVQEKVDIAIQKIDFANSVQYVTFSKNSNEQYIDLQDVIFYPNNVENKEIIWSSSNHSVASIELEKIKLIGFGTSTITATSVDGSHSSNYEIKVVGKIDVSPSIGLGYDGTSIVFQLQTLTTQLGLMTSTSQERFVTKIKIYRDNELTDEVELNKAYDQSLSTDRELNYGYARHRYIMSNCVDGEYHIEYTVIDQLTGYSVSGKSNYSKKITCIPPI